MYRRDYILAEAQKLAVILSKLFGLRADGNPDYETEFEKVWKDEYQLSEEILLNASEEEFAGIINNAPYSAEKLGALVKFLDLYTQPYSTNSTTSILMKKMLIVIDALEQKHHLQTLENIELRNFLLKELEGA